MWAASGAAQRGGVQGGFARMWGAFRGSSGSCRGSAFRYGMHATDRPPQLQAAGLVWYLLCSSAVVRVQWSGFVSPAVSSCCAVVLWCGCCGWGCLTPLQIREGSTQGGVHWHSNGGLL
jgi:hypothetical protein